MNLIERTSANIVIRLLLVLVALGSIQVSLSAQSATGLTESPTHVVERLWKMDTEGERLTNEGWQKAAEVFVRVTPPPAQRTLTIMKGRFMVGNSQIEGDKAQVGVEYLKLGTLDPSMGFTWSSPSGAVKERVFYNLVRTNSRETEPQSSNEMKRDVLGPWKINDPESQSVVLSLTTAIKYVTNVRNKANDNVVRKNASKTLSLLKGHL